MNKSAQIWLGYHKQSDDFNQHLQKQGGDVIEALRAYQDQIDEVMKKLQGVREVLEETGANDVEMEGVDLDWDTQFISITAPAKTMKKLAKKGLVEGYDDD